MIRSLTGEPVSHVAFQYGDFILHSTLCGPEIRTAGWGRQHYEVLFEVELHSSPERLMSVMDRVDRKGYDFSGLLYLGLRYMMKKYLRMSLPKANLWDCSGMLTCVEFATLVIDSKADPMLTPFGLCRRLGGKPA
jgi:hypothetical protein